MRPAPRRAALTAIPDGARRLADGFVIEASIVARLLGIRLLRVEARLVVSPAEMLTETRNPAGALPARNLRAIGSGRIGAQLAAAQRRIDEGATRLHAGRPPSGRT